MTLITRIITKSSVYIASDDQLNNKGGSKIGTTFKAFKYRHSIGAVSGFLLDKDLKFDILNEVNKYDSHETLVGGISKDIPEELHIKETILLISNLVENEIFNDSYHIHNNNVKLLEKRKSIWYRREPVSPMIRDNNYVVIEKSFDPTFYLENIDFNWNYVLTDEVLSFLYSIFHVKLFYRYGESSIKGLLQDNDDNIIDFLFQTYSFIDSLKSDNGRTGREILKGYYNNGPHKVHEEFLKTIGKCNSIMKINVKTGASILYQDI